MKKPYNGHESWNAWNVSLWISNSEWLYHLALECLNNHNKNCVKAAKELKDYLDQMGLKQTLDGAKYTLHDITLAMKGLKD